jgi:hypothetical protein
MLLINMYARIKLTPILATLAQRSAHRHHRMAVGRRTSLQDESWRDWRADSFTPHCGEASHTEAYVRQTKHMLNKRGTVEPRQIIGASMPSWPIASRK